MCGFLSLFGSHSARSITEDELKRLSQSLSHRGPDDFQVVGGSHFQLIFWRLSIVDRTYGQQPMSSERGSTIVLFNGEIYNYKSLRAELKRHGIEFRTECDTEVILYAYEIWGMDCFARFEGMFAICLIDLERRKILMVRDRLGVKPLYYYGTSDGLSVASEPKVLFALPKIDRRIDHSSIYEYLLFQALPTSKTMFKGISKVPPGTILEFSLETQGLLSASPIVTPFKEEKVFEGEEGRDAVQQSFLGNVHLCLDTDLPLSFHLSGGFDSSLLISLTRQLEPGREIHSVTSLIEGSKDPEWTFIKSAADYYGCRLDVATVTEKLFFESLDEVLYYLDEPTGDPGIVPQFLVNHLASSYGKIIFSGQGLDEMFFGYIRDLCVYLLSTKGPDFLNKAMTRDFLKGWEDFLKTFHDVPIPSPSFALFRKVCRFDPFAQELPFRGPFLESLQSIALDHYNRLLRSTTSLGDFMLALETQIQLPSLLHMEDRASMRYSVETRVPFCTASIFDLSRKIGLHSKFHGGAPKGLLRECFGEILPPAIINRREKVGRPIPLRRWLNGPFGTPFKEDLEKKRGFFNELFQMDILDYALHHSNPYDRSLWALLSLSRWMDLYKMTP